MRIGGPVSLAQTLDLSKSVAPRGNGLAAVFDEPNRRKDARIDGNEAAVGGKVLSS